MVYSRISISIDFFSVVIYHICPSLAAQPSVIHNVKEEVIKRQVPCSSTPVLPASGLLMGPSGSSALLIRMDTQGHLSMKGKITGNHKIAGPRWWHFHPKPSWFTHTLQMLKVCFPLLALKDFITVSLRTWINHSAGFLSFRDYTLPSEDLRLGITKTAHLFHFLLLIEWYFHSTC